ncbi:hypothetical protein FB45DRAFT_838882 [Roridomyces roridus]|uniref:Uncharacterized protein n=1 Tax=Roridomyces roridus TaxID=1738132 RepID=A0AAD7FFJ1_9AGAR|nr:hypothetical protein FB45DRAFT_838882 [Roridomyces roridus]
MLNHFNMSHHLPQLMAYETAAVATQASYSRPLSHNELSYFLPSRAYGLNDMFVRIIVRAPPHLMSPLRFRVAWAIMRLRHTLLACQVQMEPGCYDEARFKYTPPSSPRRAAEEAEDTLHIVDDKTGPELMDAFLDPTTPRRLSSQRISGLDVAKHGPVSPGLEEYHILIMTIHAINDGVALHRHCDMILQLLCGSATPGGPPRTDAELLRLLELEWTMRCGAPREDAIIVPATEDRLPSPRSKFQLSAWTIDHQNVKKRAIGGHALPRIKSQVCKQTIELKFWDPEETAAIRAACKARGLTLTNATFALINFAWISTAQNHPELNSSKELPMMIYTAVSLRRHLAQPSSPLSSYMSLALGYCNIVLPSFIPATCNPGAMFWSRARSAQSQMSAFSRSPLLLGRCRLMGGERALRAKAFAKQDDEADGTLPQTGPQPAQPTPVVGTPSVALLGITCLGDLGDVYRPERYPSAQFVDAFSHVRNAKGALLMSTQMLNGKFSMTLGYDAAAFPLGVVDEFWAHYVGGVREFILDSSSVFSSKL